MTFSPNRHLNELLPGNRGELIGAILNGLHSFSQIGGLHDFVQQADDGQRLILYLKENIVCLFCNLLTGLSASLAHMRGSASRIALLLIVAAVNELVLVGNVLFHQQPFLNSSMICCMASGSGV
jgi:hypothetical protein